MDLNDKFGIVDNTEMSEEMFDFISGSSKDATPIKEEDETEEPVPPSEEKEIESVFDAIVDKTKEEEPKEEEEETDDEEEDNQIQSLSNDLLELGVFSQDENLKIPETEQEFLERFEIESKKKANAELVKFLGQFGDDYFKAFQAIFVNGVNPKDYYSIAAKSEDILNLDLEQEVNQKKIVKKYYQEILGQSETRVEKMMEIIAESGELDAEATKALSEFKKIRDTEVANIENEKLLAQQRKEQEKQYFNSNVSKYIDSKVKEKDIKGLKFNEEIASDIQRKLTQPAYRLPNGEVISEFQKNILELSNPENIESAVMIALLMENNFDLSKIQAKKSSEEKEKLFKTLNKKPNKQPQQKQNSTPLDQFNIL